MESKAGKRPFQTIVSNAVTQTATEAPPDTKRRILSVAEELFAEYGFDAVSLRHITTEAGVNLAAVNYYFGSKEGLVTEVISEHCAPINRQRLSLLAEAETAAKGRALAVETIVDTFVSPVFTAAEASDGSTGRFCRLVGRVMGDRDERVRAIAAKQFPEVFAAYQRAFCRALPHLTPEVLGTRLLFMAGALVQSLLFLDQIGDVMPEQGGKIDVHTLRQQMVPFMAAGMRAPLPESPR